MRDISWENNHIRAEVDAMKTLMHRTIANATKGTTPFSAERSRALATVRWMLATDDGRFVAVNAQAQAELVRDLSQASIYDGRDNEELKVRFFEAILGVPLQVIILD